MSDLILMIKSKVFWKISMLLQRQQTEKERLLRGLFRTLRELLESGKMHLSPIF